MIYTFYMEPNARPLAGDEEGSSRFDSLIAIPEKNAYWALAFPPFWLAYHRLWFAFTIYFGLIILSIALLTTSWALVVLLLGGLPGIYLFLEGNQLRRKKLEAKGLEFVAAVEAPTKQFAFERFLSGWEALLKDVSELRKPLPKPMAQHPRQLNTVPAFGMFPNAEN